MNFVALDVETANPDMASICQIGIATYRDNKLADAWSSLIDPEDYFDPINVSIHGIDEEDVVGSPTLPKVMDNVRGLLREGICVTHTHFDRVSFEQATTKYRLRKLETTWLDSARVARRAWEDCAWSGYGLHDVCEKIGYEFKHHDALEDAKAAAQVLLAASQVCGLDIDGWLHRVKLPIDPVHSSTGAAVRREGNPQGEMYGEVVVFTGALKIRRAQAADLAASIGCSVDSGVTKKTTLLVVGDQDVSKLAGKNKSSKHIKAEQLIAKGRKIRILKESDLQELVKVASANH